MGVSSELHNKKSNPRCPVLAQKEKQKCITTEGREQAMYVFPSPLSVKPSVSALLCLCLVGKRWGTGKTPACALLLLDLGYFCACANAGLQIYLYPHWKH